MDRNRNVRSNCVVVVFCALLLMTNVDARRNLGTNQRKTPSSSSGHVTPQTYNTQSGGGSGNSHADVAKLSYPNYNSQPNRPASASSNTNSNPPQPGWNVPKDQGPPPSYSASNPAGGAKTNVHEPPPSYHQPNYAAPPPSYGASNVHTPIAATNMHGNQYAPPPGATYHSPGSLPAGATYYPSGSPGGYPGGGHSYYPGGGAMPAGGAYHPGGGALPQGASYYPAGGALPPGATYYSQPPQSSSSGLGFGTGLIAGGLGGALLGHALTPSGTQVQQAPAAAAGAAGGSDRIIIINNGVPVNATDGVTVVNGAPAANAANPAQDASTTAPLAPMSQVPSNSAENNATTMASNATNPEQPPAGGIICVPMRVNETDPADSTKMIETEKIACYPAPPSPAQAPIAADNSTVPLAPMTQPPVAPPDQAAVRAENGANANLPACAGLIIVALLTNLIQTNFAQ